VLLAGNGPEALAILDRNLDISLLFTDVGLPKGMNGRQLAEEACRRRPALRVLYTTGYARHALMQDGKLEAGITVIAKPFTDIDIALGVRAMLDGAGKSPRVVTASSAR
jgi:CheY-like chemotaxis protein